MKSAQWWMRLLAVGCLGFGPMHTLADTMTDVVGAVTWSYTVKGGVTNVTGATPAEGSLVIPETLGGCAVTTIGSHSFSNCINLTSLVIPNGVTNIGYEAFIGCSNLTSVTIPASVKTISGSAFWNCRGLQEVHIPTLGAWCDIDFRSNGANPLENAHNLYVDGTLLTEADIPEGTRNVGSFAFLGCTNLVSVVIPDSVTNIGWYAFWNCSGLTSVAIGNGVMGIADNAFEGCSNLTTVTVGNAVTDVGNRAFYQCTSLAELVLPDSVTNIGYETFSGCWNLQALWGPAALSEHVREWGLYEEMWQYGGSGCSGYTSWGVYFREEGSDLGWRYVVTNGVAVFLGVSEITGHLDIPATLGGYPVKGIGRYALGYCSDLTSVTIPDGVEWIEEEAFSGAYSLTNLVVPDSVTSIGTNAFSYSGLQTLWMPSPLAEHLGEWGLHEKLWQYGGSGCSGYTTWGVYFREDGSDLGWRYVVTNGVVTVLGVSELGGDFMIPEALGEKPVEGIGEYAFGNCDQLLSVNIPEGITFIGQSAFAYCPRLTTVTLPGSVESIGNDAFTGCNGLAEMYVPASWEGTSMLSNAGVPSGCRIVYVAENDLHAITIASGITGGTIVADKEEAAKGETVILTVTPDEGMKLVPGSLKVSWRTIEGTSFVMPGKAVTVTAKFAPYVATVNIGGVRIHQWDGTPKEVEVTTVPAGLEVDVRYDGENALPSAAGEYEVIATVMDGFFEGSARGTLEIVDAKEYLVVDLSGGTNATTWPVTTLYAVPDGGWGNEFKTTKLVLRKLWPGTYIMGCETNEVGYTGYEAVPHKVTISKPFYIGVFELTQKQWELVMGNNPARYKGNMRPVEYVSFNDIRGASKGAEWPGSNEVDAGSFLGVLRAKTDGVLWDLPTEAQWEYACRAGTTTALNSGKNLTKSGGGADPQMNEVGRYAFNCNAYLEVNSDDSHTTVGSYLPNVWGLYDMHGNVLEWTLDWYQGRNQFSTNTIVDPTGPVSGSYRVSRSGYFNLFAKYCRSAHRFYDEHPSSRGYGRGFRLACSSEKQKQKQSIEWAEIGVQIVTGRVVLAATATSGGEVTFEVVSGPGSISGNILTFMGTGEVVVRATQSGNARWEAVDATQTVTVTAFKTAQNIEWATIGAQTATANVPLFATATSGGAITFEVVSGPGAIAGNVLMFMGAGEVVVKATQAGNAVWEAAEATQTVTVSRAGQSIGWAAIGTCGAAETVTLGAVATGGGNVEYEVVSGPGSIANGKLSFTGTGEVVVRAVQAGDAIWLPAESEQTVTVVLSQQGIEWAPIGAQVVTGKVALAATASGGGAVAFEVVSGPGTIEGGVLRFTGEGSVTVRASAAEDARWTAASAEQMVAVSKVPQRIVWTEIGEVSVTNRVALSATATSGGEVAFDVVSGPGRIEGTELAFTGGGPVEWYGRRRRGMRRGRRLACCRR